LSELISQEFRREWKLCLLESALKAANFLAAVHGYLSLLY